MTAPRRAAAILTALLLLASGCSTGGSSDGASSSSTTTSSAGSVPTTTGPLGSGPPPIVDALRVEVLSSQPDRVTGDDARVRVSPGPDHDITEVRLLLGDDDVTAQLHATNGKLEGVVRGFIEGNNTLTARAGTEEAVQRVRAWPLTGPVFSGPQLPLYGCTTEVLGLGPPTDDACSAPRRVTWRYVNAVGAIVDLPDGGAPADLATADIDGRAVPLYVRVERGTLDRSVYELASIASGPDDARLDDAWNGRFVARLGGDCGTTFGQGTGLVPADVDLLRRGYAVVTATSADAGPTCNDVLAAEVLSMAKERAIELLGVPRFTIGVGERGGAALAHLIVQDYPGILNGVVALDPLPDHLTTLSGVADCEALQRYFATTTGAKLSAAQRRAITGTADAACGRWSQGMFGALVPTEGCDPAVPEDRRYDATLRPNGIRCTVFDSLRNQLGTSEANTVWRTLDNEGLQYGLEAFNAGTITFDQFLDLNRSIGGWGSDGQPSADRAIAWYDGVGRAYETGRVSMGGGDQLAVPIIDIDRYDDSTGSLYDLRRAFALRDRLSKGRGTDAAPGMQIWVRAADDPRTATVHLDAVDAIDAWLTSLADDDEGGSMTQVLRRTRPADAVDQCLAKGEATPRRGLDVFDPDDGTCVADFPIGGDPRTAAGGPRSGHVLKCTLKAPDLLDYDADLTSEQFREIQQTFPTGVCDWFVPSAGQTTPAAPDRTYEDVTSPEQSA